MEGDMKSSEHERNLVCILNMRLPAQDVGRGGGVMQDPP